VAIIFPAKWRAIPKVALQFTKQYLPFFIAATPVKVGHG
jgi:hypothetical protein